MSDNVFRTQYRELSETEKEFIANLKHQAEILYGLMDKSIPKGEHSERTRCLALGKTNLEQAVMWAIKGLTL